MNKLFAGIFRDQLGIEPLPEPKALQIKPEAHRDPFDALLETCWQNMNGWQFVETAVERQNAQEGKERSDGR